MKKSTIAPLLFFLAIAAVLIFCWFRFGHIYGGGDTGLPLYNPKVMANLSTNIWWESLAPGIPVAQGLTSVPVLYILSIPQMLGASPIFIQGLLFFTLLFLMGYGMYSLALSIFGRSNNLMALAAGVFYMFNPYMMIQIWHRFIHNSMFFVAFLPYLVMTWLLWIRKRNPIYLLLFLLVNFLAVYVYGSIAFIVTVWTLLILLTLMEAIFPWKGKKEALKLSLAFLIGFVLWLLTNSWWVIPTFSVNPSLFASQHTTDDSLGTLMALSPQTVLPYTLRLINPFYLYLNADWGNIYQSPIFLILSWLFVPVVFIGFFKGFKEKTYVSWSLLFLIIIYLSKGAAPPFSFPYIFGFSHFFPLGVIRNPFEKLGIMLPFVFAICFALGLQCLVHYSTKYIGKFKTILLLIFFILTNVIFLHPYFTGKLFGSFDKPSYVEVPKSYTEANNWLEEDNKKAGVDLGMNGVLLQLPLPRTEGATYKWNHGYNGVDPSAAIFTSLPSIARGLDLPRVSDALSGLSLIFHKPNATTNHQVILKMLQDFSVKYIILHKDIEWLGGELYNPQETETVLDNLDFLTKEKTFGDLIIYKVKDIYFSPKITLSDNIQLLYPSKNNLFWPWVIATPSADLLTPVGEQNDVSIKNIGSLLFPQDQFEYKEATSGNLKEVINNLISNPSYTGSSLNNLLQIKNVLVQQTKDSRGIEMAQKIIDSSQLLLKIYAQSSVNSSEIASSIQNLYLPQIKDIFKNNTKITQVIPYSREEDIINVFQLQYFILSELTNKVSPQELPELQSVLNSLKDLLVKSNLMPVYPLDISKNWNGETANIQKFQIPYKSEYEILMSDTNAKDSYTNKLSSLSFWVNGKSFSLNGKEAGDLISFGKVDIDVGLSEIGYSMISSQNLLPDLETINKHGDIRLLDNNTIQINSSDKESFYFDGDIAKVYGQSQYKVSLEVLVKQASVFFVQMLQDSDSEGKVDPSPLRNGIKDVPVSQFFLVYPNDLWQSYSLTLPPLRSTTQHVKLRIAAYSLPMQNSLDGVNPLFIRNLKVERVLNNPLILRTDNKEIDNLPVFSGEISSQIKLNPSLYEGKLKLNKPAFLIFKETLYPGWKLELYENNNIYTPEKQYLASSYANAWFIEKAGDYSFKIKFEPQNQVTLGIIIAGLSYIGIGVLVFKNHRKK